MHYTFTPVNVSLTELQGYEVTINKRVTRLQSYKQGEMVKMKKVVYTLLCEGFSEDFNRELTEMVECGWIPQLESFQLSITTNDNGETYSEYGIILLKWI